MSLHNAYNRNNILTRVRVPKHVFLITRGSWVKKKADNQCFNAFTEHVLK